tara:strand:+ start:6454 stop:7071 length:618 start_codon:yes stop_codon:yes gene_type:complete
MPHGTSRIIQSSKLKPEWREVLLTAEYFKNKPVNLTDLSAFTNYFDPEGDINLIESTIIEFLDNEQFYYKDKKIEYWFQHQVTGQNLAPHCDYNHSVREAIGIDDGKWLHEADKTQVMSPVTIGCYLECNNLLGGELCISEYDWFEHPTPTFIDPDDIVKHPYEMFVPEQDDVIYFEGSKYFHWINDVKRGERKSMMINFWQKDL